MAKKATNPAPVASEKVSEEVVTSTVPETPVAPETEATTSTAIDQPAVSDDASASSSSDVEPEAPSFPAEPAIVEPVVEPVVEPTPEPTIIRGGGGFDSPFAEVKPAPTMIERIEALEKKVAALEAK